MDIQDLITREMEKLMPVAESKEPPAKPAPDEKANSDSPSKPKISSELKKSKNLKRRVCRCKQHNAQVTTC